jgi:hypothetical protein
LADAEGLFQTKLVASASTDFRKDLRVSGAGFRRKAAHAIKLFLLDFAVPAEEAF